jgi:hypothetical protein
MTQGLPPGKPAWPAGALLPQRYAGNYPRYRERGGQVDLLEDAFAYGQGRMGDPPRFLFLSLLFDQIRKEGLVGDVAELGVYKGETATILARNARRLGRTTWLLDTFAGFDTKDFTGIDAGQGPLFEDTSLDAVRARVGDDQTRYVQGFFPDTAVQLPPDGRYCLVHIDCDLYAPIASALEYFYPRVVPGGFIVVHDYGSLAWAGAEKAVDQFFADKPEGVVPMPDSASSVVVRKQRGRERAVNWLQSKQLVPVGEWLLAGNNQLAELLTDGWSRPEAWGIWGVGASHVLNIGPADPTLSAFVVDLELHAPLLPGRPTQTVDVLVDGVAAAQWRFTMNNNRAVHSLSVWQSAGAGEPVRIELRPHSVAAPRDIDPATKEARPLGVGLRRLRVRAPEAA